MGRNSAFGRPSATERAQRWWGTTSPASRQNLLLAVGVMALFVAIILAAVARDRSPARSRITSARPQPTSTVLFTPSTVFVGNLAGAAATTPPPASSTTTVTTTAPAARAEPTTTVQPATPPAPASTQAPAPVTTAVNPNVIYTEVPVETTIPRPATTTTVPTTLASTTTVPTSTLPSAPPSTSVPASPLTVPGALRL